MSFQTRDRDADPDGAREWTQQYEWAYHYPIALKEGLAKSTIDAVAEGSPAESMKEDEAVATTSHRAAQARSVSDASYARALALFGERGIVDLVGVSVTIAPRHDDECTPAAPSTSTTCRR